MLPSSWVIRIVQPPPRGRVALQRATPGTDSKTIGEITPAAAAVTTSGSCERRSTPRWLGFTNAPVTSGVVAPPYLVGFLNVPGTLILRVAASVTVERAPAWNEVDAGWLTVAVRGIPRAPERRTPTIILLE